MDPYDMSSTVERKIPAMTLQGGRGMPSVFKTAGPLQDKLQRMFQNDSGISRSHAVGAFTNPVSTHSGKDPVDLGLPEDRDIILPVDFHQQEQTYQRHIQQLEKENNFLKDYVQRILAQMKRVLIKHNDMESLQQMQMDASFKSHGPESDELLNEDVKSTPPWFTSPEYVCPLFAAYDSRIQELEILCDKSSQEMEGFATQTENLAKENEQLRKDLSHALDKLIMKAETTSSPAYQSTNLDVEETQERIDILMAENNLLMEQNTIQDSELEAMRNELQEREDQVLTMSNNFNQATLVVQKLRDSCENLSREKQQCERKLQHFAAMVAQLEAENERLQQLLSDAKSFGDLEKQKNIKNENKLQEIMKTQQKENEKLNERHALIAERLRELASQCESKDIKIEDLEEAKHALSCEIETVRADCEGMLKVMTGMEKQLEEYAGREEATKQIEKDSKARVEEMILDRDQVKSREVQCRREIARLLEKRQNEAEEYMKAQERALQDLRQRHTKEQAALELEMTRLVNENTTLKEETDKSSRIEKSASRELSQLKNILQSEREYLEERFNGLLLKLAESEETRDKAIQEATQLNQNLKSMGSEFETERVEHIDSINMYKDKIRAYERELGVKRSELREFQQNNIEKEKELEKLKNELNVLKIESAVHQSKVLYTIQENNKELQARLQSTESELLQVKAHALKTEDLLRGDSERTISKYRSELEMANNTMHRLREDKNRLETQNQDLNIRVNTLEAEISAIEHDLSEQEEQQSRWQSLLDESERKASDLSAQLSMAITKQQQQLRLDKENRGALDRMKLEKGRLEHEIQSLRSMQPLHKPDVL